MNTKHLLFAYSLSFTTLPVKPQFGKQTGGASFAPGAISSITTGTNRFFTSMYNMHCCC